MIKTSWDLTPLFKSDTDPAIEKERQEIEAAAQKFAATWQNRTDYLAEPKILLAALTDYEKFMANHGFWGKQGFYFELRTSLDQNNPHLKANENKVEDFSRNIENQLQFFELQIGKIPAEAQKKFLTYPGLGPYRHFLELRFSQAKFELSDPEEKIINLKDKVAYANWVRLTTGLLAKTNFTQLAPQLASQDKKVRDTAGKAVDKIAEDLVEVAEAELNSVLENKKINDDLRHASRPDLIRHVGDDIDSHTVDVLVESVASRFDIPTRFYQTFAQLLGQKTLGYHERAVTYGKIDKDIPFNEAVTLVTKVFNQLDPDFAAIFQNYISSGRVDVFPHTGKRAGAFCAWQDQTPTMPTFVLLNYTNKLTDVLTIAHEFGHAINSELMRRQQSALNFGSPVSVTEVASTFMEDFVLDEILKTADDELRLSLMVAKLQEDINTIFRQIGEYKFEQDLHREFRAKGYLAKETIGQLFATNMSAVNGPAVVMTSKNKNWWVQWHHVRYFFYVYSYASGQLISKALQTKVRANPKFISQIKTFLAAGTSDSPKNIFLKLGINIYNKNFWDQGLNEIDTLLEETTNLAKKLGKI